LYGDSSKTQEIPYSFSLQKEEKFDKDSIKWAKNLKSHLDEVLKECKVNQMQYLKYTALKMWAWIEKVGLKEPNGILERVDIAETQKKALEEKVWSYLCIFLLLCFVLC